MLHLLQALVDRGNSVLVIEHNLDMIKSADWVIDMGPGGGVAGGKLVAAGTPEQVAAVDGSLTGHYLADALRQHGAQSSAAMRLTSPSVSAKL